MPKQHTLSRACLGPCFCFLWSAHPVTVFHYALLSNQVTQCIDHPKSPVKHYPNNLQTICCRAEVCVSSTCIREAFATSSKGGAKCHEEEGPFHACMSESPGNVTEYYVALCFTALGNLRGLHFCVDSVGILTMNSALSATDSGQPSMIHCRPRKLVCGATGNCLLACLKTHLTVGPISNVPEQC